MNFGQAFRYPFNMAKWFMNAVLVAVCFIIPVIGPLVLMGYGTLVIKMAVRDPQAQPPVFDFGLFMKYLERGVAPFVVSLIASLALIPLIFLCWVPFIIAMAVGASHGKGDAGVMVAMAISLVLEVAGIMAFSLLVIPIQLKSELEGKIGASFDFKYTMSFMGRMWGQVLLMAVVLAGLGIVGSIVGILMCFVGIYLVMGMLMMMQWHMRAQLYLMSLERGVMPLVIKEDELLRGAVGGFPPVMNG
jgi:Protein of unknown function (DUF4013)